MDIEKMSYEESMEKLEEIVKSLESQELTLESPVEKFKLGMDLYEHSINLLNKAETEVKILLDGQEVDFMEV